MTKLLLFIRSALSGLRQTPFVHAVAILTLSIALFAGTLARALQITVRDLMAKLGSEVEVTLYLAESAPDAQVAEAESAVKAESGWPVRRVSPDQALARLKQELRDSRGALDGLPENPLPRSLEALPPHGVPPASIRQLADRWLHLPGVTAVDYGNEWVDRLAALQRTLEVGATALLALVLAAAVVVVAATLQLAVYARRDEIEIQKLVGATDSFVKIPYVIEGMLQGLVAAALACTALYACQRGLAPRLAESLAFLLGGIKPIALADPRRLLEALAAGLLMGVAGSSIAVGRFLRV